MITELILCFIFSPPTPMPYPYFSSISKRAIIKPKALIFPLEKRTQETHHSYQSQNFLRKFLLLFGLNGAFPIRKLAQFKKL